jgi:hypothetical protein
MVYCAGRRKRDIARLGGGRGAIPTRAPETSVKSLPASEQMKKRSASYCEILTKRIQ